jgi:ATP-dependent exoDNAse (exonuclease V) beta subunit
MEFTAQQLRAIDIAQLGQDMCVVAGPGSGKTTVLVERFRRLVCEAGISPSRILAITFTEKAATNMKQKLAAAFRDRPEARRLLERAYVSTVHGFCMRLLRENAIFAGVDPEFRVLDERQQTTMQAAVVSEALDGMFGENPELMRRLTEALPGSNLGEALLETYEAVRSGGEPLSNERGPAPGDGSFADLIDRARSLAREHPVNWSVTQRGALREVIAWSERHSHLRDAPVSREHFTALENFEIPLRRMRRNNAVYDRVKALKDSVEEVYRRLLTDFYAAEKQTLVDAFQRFDRMYRERKQASAVLDYSDLEEYTVRLLEENAAVRERVRGQFDQVLMDEFQDTNGLQAKLLKLVRPPDRFYAVGDINQSIYGFRHAEPRVFRDYREEVERAGGPLAALTENWRSRPEILQAVTTVLRGVEGIEERALVAAQEFPEKAGPSVEAVSATAADLETALALETKWVARRILELEGALRLRKRLAGFRDIAVLVRNTEVTGAFAAAFDEAGIPYLVGRGRGFYESREITDLVHMLRVLAKQEDEISMAAVLRSPLAGVSDEALLRLKQCGTLGDAVRHLEMNAHAAADLWRLERFRALLRDLRAVQDFVSFDRLLLRAMDSAGHAYEPGSRAAANVEKFLAIARDAASRLTLAEFVDELELIRAADPRDTDAPPEDLSNAVRIMTVHAAKGLEFPVVFLAAMHKGMDTNLGDISFSPRLGLGARWRNPVTGEEKDDLYHQAIRQERKQREADEGHRLLYVAMTRAEEHLVLSYSRTESAPKNWAALVEERMEVSRVTRPPELPARERVISERGEMLRVEAPPAAGQYDSNATVTSVTMFGNCPRRYYLERYLGWEGKAVSGEGSGGASEFGLQVHALLAGIEVKDCHPAAVRLVETFRATVLGRRVARAGTVEREFDFLLAIEDVVLRGQIDVWFEDQELILVDYKTDADPRPEAYGEQLRLYAMALEQIAGRLPDHAYICFLRSGEAVPVDLSPLALHATRALVREFRDAQESLAFPIRPGEQCQRCPYFRDLCPAEPISLSTCAGPLSSPAAGGRH